MINFYVELVDFFLGVDLRLVALFWDQITIYRICSLVEQGILAKRENPITLKIKREKEESLVISYDLLSETFSLYEKTPLD